MEKYSQKKTNVLTKIVDNPHFLDSILHIFFTWCPTSTFLCSTQ